MPYRIHHLYSDWEIVEKYISHRLPKIEPKEILERFQNFMSAGESADYIFYTKAQVREEIEVLVEYFIRDIKVSLGEAQDESFAEKIARETGLEIVQDGTEKPCIVNWK